MKLTIWDILSIFLIIATVVVAIFIGQIYSDPSGGLNPFPPPTMPSQLVLPTYTATVLRLPATWTPTAGEPVDPALAGTMRPTSTALPTATGFVLPTPTPTPTYTPTRTLTFTPSRTPTRTATPTLDFTATYNAVSTQVAAGQTATSAVSTANALGTQTALTQTAAPKP